MIIYCTLLNSPDPMSLLPGNVSVNNVISGFSHPFQDFGVVNADATLNSKHDPLNPYALSENGELTGNQ